MVRDFKRLLIYSLIPTEIDQYVQEMSREFGIEVIPVESPEIVVRESDALVTTTPTHKPYLKADWVHPGMHITCMGSDSEEKQELHADVFGRANRVFCDRKSQCFRLGELHHALEADIISPDDNITELGELTAGLKPGRQRDDEITICDLTGVGVQDTQIARLAYQRAQARGLGVSFGD